MDRSILMKVRKFLFFTFIIVVGFTIKIPERVYAAEFSDVQVIPLNTSVEGNVTQGYENEQDYYKFELPSAGSVFINFSNPMQADADVYWEMYLYNSSYKELDSTKIKGNTFSTDSTIIGLDAGEYYIKVHSAGYSEAYSTDKYIINVNYKESNVWEKEFNEDYVSATYIDLNTTYYGTTRKSYENEQDFYRFSLEDDGKIILKFSNPLQADSDEYWKVYIYNSKYDLLCSKTIYGNNATTDLPSMGLPAGVYYIKIISTGYSSAASTDQYNITVNYEESEYWEKELNEDFTTATDIILGYDYNGTTHSGWDYEQDYYKFKITSTGMYMVGITTFNLENNDEYWEMHLYNSSYEEIGKVVVYGNKTYHEISKTLSPGVYYIKVNSTGYSSAASTSVYKLKVADTTKKEIQKFCDHNYENTYVEATYFSRGYTLYTCIKCGKSYKDEYISKKKLNQGYLNSYCYSGERCLNLYWSTITDASGYQIRYCTKKDFKKGTIVKKVTGQPVDRITIKKLKHNKKYYVQVRAYKTYGSKTVYGKWSIKIRLKTK